MNKPSATRHPELKRDWDAYGHSIEWKDLCDAKIVYRASGGGFAALAWHEDGAINHATLACAHDMKWEMQDDSHSTMSAANWRKSKPAPECDWLDYPEDAFEEGE